MTSSSRITNLEELSRALRAALLGDAADLVEALYEVEDLEDDDLRPLVARARAETARFLGMAKERLKPASCEVLSAERRGTSCAVTLLLDGATRLEVLVDDVYERAGCLHTRDVVQIKLLPAPAR